MFDLVVYSSFTDSRGTREKAYARYLMVPFVPQPMRMIGLLRTDEGTSIADITWDLQNNRFEARLVGGIDAADLENGIHPVWMEL